MVYKSDSKGLKWSRRLNWSKNIRNSQVLLEMALSKMRFMQFTLNLTNPFGVISLITVTNASLKYSVLREMIRYHAKQISLMNRRLTF